MNDNLISSHRISREGAEEESDHSLLINRWYAWKKVMVPAVTHHQKNIFSKRSGAHKGFRRKELDKFFASYGDKCGIYEWRAKRKEEVTVVYIGSTCRAKYGSLWMRISEYCRDGSHKKGYINDALKKGYELEVRVKTARSKLEAEVLENELLEKYDYAWNERRNGIRKILH